MRYNRVYVPSTDLAENQRMMLGKDIRHRLVNVLRLKVGQEIIVFNGRAEIEARGILVQSDRKQVLLDITELIETQRESPQKITLVQGVGKSEHMDFAIQKAVELGAHAIQLINTDRTQGKLVGSRLGKKIAHWEAIIISACEQSGRCLIPSLSPPLPFLDYLTYSPNNEARIILSPDASKTLNQVTAGIETPVNLLIGPEGGFTANEVSSAIAHGVMAATLGPRVLRTETAATAALSCVQQTLGDL